LLRNKKTKTCASYPSKADVAWYTKYIQHDSKIPAGDSSLTASCSQKWDKKSELNDDDVNRIVKQIRVHLMSAPDEFGEKMTILAHLGNQAEATHKKEEEKMMTGEKVCVQNCLAEKTHC
jgi:hypothetical protein